MNMPLVPTSTSTTYTKHTKTIDTTGSGGCYYWYVTLCVSKKTFQYTWLLCPQNNNTPLYDVYPVTTQSHQEPHHASSTRHTSDASTTQTWYTTTQHHKNKKDKRGIGDYTTTLLTYHTPLQRGMIVYHTRIMITLLTQCSKLTAGINTTTIEPTKTWHVAG